MKIRFVALSIPMLFASNLALAQDVSDEVPLQTRGQVRQELQNMTPEERALYREMNADRLRSGEAQGNGQRQNRKGEGKGKGEMKRLRDGSGNGITSRSEYRQRSEQRSSYGSGFGSRMGGGGGHGRR